MSHLPSLVWDFADRLKEAPRAAGGAQYVYDTAGERVRKVITSPTGTLRSERLYLGGFEVYREFNANSTGVTLQRQSLHVTDDQQRIALVETESNPSGVAVAEPLQRHQLGNHLDSASLELAAGGALISYEEYHPYGAPGSRRAVAPPRSS